MTAACNDKFLCINNHSKATTSVKWLTHAAKPSQAELSVQFSHIFTMHMQ